MQTFNFLFKRARDFVDKLTLKNSPVAFNSGEIDSSELRVFSNDLLPCVQDYDANFHSTLFTDTTTNTASFYNSELENITSLEQLCSMIDEEINSINFQNQISENRGTSMTSLATISTNQHINKKVFKQNGKKVIIVKRKR